MKKMNNKGFSLVELIVVIAIMAVLVGVLAPQFIKYVERSRVSTDMQNMQLMKTAVEVQVAGALADASDYEISISKTDKKISCNKALDSSKQEIALKSGNWSDHAYKYDSAAGKWTIKTAGSTTTNSTNPAEYDTTNIFE